MTSGFLFRVDRYNANIYRFGNYIGEPEESDEEHVEPTYVNQYLDDDEEEEAQAANDQQLMDLDGMKQDTS